MAHSKADQFETTLFTQSFWSKLQAHPARIIILTHLLENGPSPFFELNKKIALAGPTVSQHIRTLLNAGVVTILEKYPKAIYQLNNSTCNNLAIELTNLQMSFINKENMDSYLL